MRNYRRMLVSFEFLTSILRGFQNGVASNAPEDVEVVDAYIEDDFWPHYRMVLILKSESFTSIPEGERIPMIDSFIFTKTGEE